ncbi:hypothetical protein CRE_03467 [Caenorhabditis remanei]|uniref:F-box domain-containing protein n=1 Tax=Caenorhabditis remanei TaxID=31234 RepID=E3NGP1_CAERE|nr:hypothetical protein CRE_03467 [Caenorhabditis remanei]
MEIAKPFPILKLPFLVLIDIVKNLKKLEIIELSLASKKCRLIIKSIKIPNPGVDFKLVTSTELSQTANDGRVPCSQQQFNYLTNYLKLRTYDIDGADITVEFERAWAEYVCDLFGNNISSLIFDSNISDLDLASLSKWINKRQSTSKMRLCRLYGDCSDSDSISLFFGARTFSIYHLSIQLKFSSKVTPINFGTLDMDEFVAQDEDIKHIPNWITVESVLTSNCVRIWIELCPFTGTDLNQIIKGWINGNNPRLEILHLAIKPFDLDQFAEGIEYEQREFDLLRFYSWNSDGMFRREVTIRKGFDIVGHDGTVATFKIENRRWNDERLWDFTLVVWKNGC